MTEEMMRQLAADIEDGKVFGSWSLRECDGHLVTSIFMPIVFMSSEQRDEFKEKDVAHFYEYLDKAGPRSINGYPMFPSMAYINKKDWLQTWGYIKEYRDKKESFLKPKDAKPKQDEGPTLFDEDDNNG